MYQSYIQTLTTTILVLGIGLTLSAQMPIYSYTFTDTLEGWTIEAISSANADSSGNALWVWTPNGNAGSGAFNSGAIPIGSVSGGGAILFDSDGLDNGGDPLGFGQGPAPSPQKGEITSPALDFSGESKVILSFYQLYRYFAKDDGDPEPSTADFTTPASSYEVSGDGGATWTTFEINADITPNNSTRATSVIAQDISDIAAGQSDVRVKFVWDGEYYFWLIDDVQFFSERGADLSIYAYTNLNNFESPDISLADDTTDLEVLILNSGDADVTDSVMVWTRILDNSLNVVWSDTGYFEGINQGDTLWYDFVDWIPGELAQNASDENYILAYNVRVKGDTMGEIVKPDDNVDFSPFVVSDFTALKVPGGDGFGFAGQTPGGDFEDFEWGNLYSLSPSLTETFEVSRVTFEAFSTDTDNDPLVGKNVLAYIFELPYNTVESGDTLLLVELDSNQISINNFNLEGTIDEMIAADQLIGIGSYQFTQVDDDDGGPFSVEVSNFVDDEEPVQLRAGYQYFVVIQYQGTANTIAQEISRTYDMYQISTLAHYPSLGNGNSFLLLSTSGTNYAENVAAIGMELQLSTAVDENPLPENSVKIFPNPVSDFVKVDIDFDGASVATIFIADMNGKILLSDTKKNIQTQQLTYDMTRYPSGSYIVRVSTNQGTKTEHILVTH